MIVQFDYGEIMNSLVQQETTIIGTAQDILALESKEEASILIISDSHGDYHAVASIIEAFGPQSDALVFCGDGFCDFIEYFENSLEDEKMKESLPPVIIAVKGNGDTNTYSIETKSEGEVNTLCNYVLSNRLTCSIAGRGIFVTHGDHYRVDMGTETLLAAAHAVDSDMVFFGHTHKPHWEEAGGTLILNPGSCTRPRTQLGSSFAVVSFPGEQDRFKVQYYGLTKGIFNNHTFTPLAVHMY